jgi:regulator of sigma E protease
MQILETVFYLIVTLGVLVFVHEFGHFIAAKIFRMRVDRFSIGFPPRAFGKQIGETDYCVSWIPIGGYVKIAGMIDESFDTDHLNHPVEPWEFRAKPIWQRIVVISSGVLMNIVLAIVIFWGINYHQGKIVRETTEIGYVQEETPAAKAGLRAGDKVVRINGTPVTNWDQIYTDIYIDFAGTDIQMTVLRDSQETDLAIRRTEIPEPSEHPFGIIPSQTKIAVHSVNPGDPADRLGLKPGDAIISLGGTPIRDTEKVREIVRAHPNLPLDVEWVHDDSLMRGTVVPTQEGKIGMYYGPSYTGPVTQFHYSLLEALPQGVKDVVSASGLFLQQIGQIITGKSSFSQSVGGPIRIAQMATQTAELGLVTYLGFIALLSVSLAILNILPFPALDGGHLVFLIYEGIFRREIPVKIKLGLQKAGMIILLAFMAVVVFNDILHF